MSFKSSPAEDGAYHIKVLGQDLYLEAIPKAESVASTPWMRLAAKSSSNKQEWNLVKDSTTSNEWKITSSADSAGLVYKKTSQTYRGHGFPYPGGESIKWKITEYDSKYSKISAPVNGTDCFDSQYRSQNDDAVHFWTSLSQSSGPLQCYVFERVQPTVKLDVLFLQDATGSQQPYLTAARNEISMICTTLKKTGGFQDDKDLRFGLIAFRDHPPQDTTFITKSYAFTSDTSVLFAELEDLKATGGGDGPEAQSDALNAALNASWLDDAAKVVILITDSPPHGIETSGDSFPDGCPEQYDPVALADRMKDFGITLHVIVCEPTLSGYYKNALDFYTGLVDKTPNGTIIPLGNADNKQLRNAITAQCAISINSAQLTAKLRSNIQKQSFVENRGTDDIVTNILASLTAEGVKHHAVKPLDIYIANENGAFNVEVWSTAKTLKEAKTKLKTVEGERVHPEYRNGGTFEVTHKPEPITRENVNNIVLNAIRQGIKR